MKWNIMLNEDWWMYVAAITIWWMSAVLNNKKKLKLLNLVNECMSYYIELILIWLSVTCMRTML